MSIIFINFDDLGSGVEGATRAKVGGQFLMSINIPGPDLKPLWLLSSQ